MNKILSVIILFCFFSSDILAQESTSLKGARIKDEVIYLILDSNKLEYFSGSQSSDSRKNVSEKMRFSLKDNHCNLYLKWINPLKYQLSFRDTIYIDERDKVIGDFIKVLAVQFGIKTKSSEEENKKTNLGLQRDITRDLVNTLLYIPKNGFHDIGLIYFYQFLLSNLNALESDDISSLNSLTKLVEDLDNKNAIDINKQVYEMYRDLFNLEEPAQARNTITTDLTQIEKIKILYKEIHDLQEEVIRNLKGLKISSILIENNTRAVISDFVYRTELALTSNKNLVSKLDSVIDIFRKSVADESAGKDTKGYFRVKQIEFEEGKKLESSLQITKFRLNQDTLNKADKNLVCNVIKTNTIKRKLIFEKYDIIDVWVSAGIFHSTTSLIGYGVSNNPGGQFTLTQDTIKKNSPLTAIFLNLNFDVGSRYLAPLIQLGIDPTRKNPFLLLGGGFSIPIARFAITGGGIWTWTQSLDKLSVGQTISSTTDLENDIRYKFDVNPKGWYLGIQYNF